MFKTTNTQQNSKHEGMNKLANQNTSFSQNQFVGQNQEQHEFAQTPRFLSEIDVRSIKENSIIDSNEAIAQLLDDFKSIGFYIQEASEHQIQNNKNSEVQEQFQLKSIFKNQEKGKTARQQSQCSSINKSFFFVDSLFLKNLKGNCSRLKLDLKLLPSEISKFLVQAQQIFKDLTQKILCQTYEYFQSYLQKIHEEMEEVIRKEHTIEEQNECLRLQIAEISREVVALRQQTCEYLKMKQQFEHLEVTNQEQCQIIRELQQKIYQLQYKVKQSTTHCSIISSMFKESSEGLEKKYEKILQEMRVALTHQIKTEVYYKLKYGYTLDLDREPQKKTSFANIKLSSSHSFEEINEVINNLREINSCLIQRTKFYA